MFDVVSQEQEAGSSVEVAEYQVKLEVVLAYRLTFVEESSCPLDQQPWENFPSGVGE